MRWLPTLLVSLLSCGDPCRHEVLERGPYLLRVWDAVSIVYVVDPGIEPVMEVLAPQLIADLMRRLEPDSDGDGRVDGYPWLDSVSVRVVSAGHGRDDCGTLEPVGCESMPAAQTFTTSICDGVVRLDGDWLYSDWNPFDLPDQDWFRSEEPERWSPTLRCEPYVFTGAGCDFPGSTGSFVLRDGREVCGLVELTPPVHPRTTGYLHGDRTYRVQFESELELGWETIGVRCTDVCDAPVSDL